VPFAGECTERGLRQRFTGVPAKHTAAAAGCRQGVAARPIRAYAARVAACSPNEPRITHYYYARQDRLGRAMRKEG